MADARALVFSALLLASALWSGGCAAPRLASSAAALPGAQEPLRRAGLRRELAGRTESHDDVDRGPGTSDLRDVGPPTWRSLVAHLRLIDAAALAYPVILAADGTMMDGRHRAAKALREGRPAIDAVQFPVDPPPDYVGCAPDELPYSRGLQDRARRADDHHAGGRDR